MEREREEHCSEIEEIEDEVDKRFKKFENFRVLPSYAPLDHEFRPYIYGYSRSFDAKMDPKINKEWKTLKAKLPSSIFVTTYKYNPDLMQACIIGLEGTPYCYGLFFFDIMVADDPAKPPKIHYHYKGFDLNPKLHRDGKVSLDILGLDRWYKWLFGCKEQSSNPEQSDILQVLLSIQYSILNDKPYLNDSIFFRTPLYTNNEVFILSCKTMLNTMRFMPSDYCDFVKGHFRKQAHNILLIYKDQMLKHGNSNNKVMKHLFIKLVRAFEGNGAYCRHHCNQMEIDELKKMDSPLKNVPDQDPFGNVPDQDPFGITI